MLEDPGCGDHIKRAQVLSCLACVCITLLHAAVVMLIGVIDRHWLSGYILSTTARRYRIVSSSVWWRSEFLWLLAPTPLHVLQDYWAMIATTSSLPLRQGMMGVARGGGMIQLDL